LKEKSVIVWRW